MGLFDKQEGKLDFIFVGVTCRDLTSGRIGIGVEIERKETIEEAIEEEEEEEERLGGEEERVTEGLGRVTGMDV